MEEHEVDLGEYLNVVWERKWIILSVFLVATATASVYSFNLPNEYEASTLARLDTKPPTSNIQLDLPTPIAISELMKQKELWLQSIQLFPLEGSLSRRDPGILAQELARGFQVQRLGDNSLMTLRLRGNLRPDDLKLQLSHLIVAAQTLLQEQIRESTEQQIASLEGQEVFLNQRKAALISEIQSWIDSREASLQKQKEALLKQLAELFNLGKVGGQNASAQSYTMQPFYVTLITQLQALEGEMIRLQTEKEAQSPRPGSGFDTQLDELESTLQQLEFSKNEYQALLKADWTPIQSVGEPQALLQPVGPSRKLNIAIAGALGLFVGLLLAFFVHYLGGGLSKPSEAQISSDTAKSR